MNKNGLVTREELENLEFMKPLTKISNIVSSLAVVYSALEKFSSVGKKKTILHSLPLLSIGGFTQNVESSIETPPPYIKIKRFLFVSLLL